MYLIYDYLQLSSPHEDKVANMLNFSAAAYQQAGRPSWSSTSECCQTWHSIAQQDESTNSKITVIKTIVLGYNYTFLTDPV